MSEVKYIGPAHLHIHLPAMPKPKDYEAPWRGRAETDALYGEAFEVWSETVGALAKTLSAPIIVKDETR